MRMEDSMPASTSSNTFPTSFRLPEAGCERNPTACSPSTSTPAASADICQRLLIDDRLLDTYMREACEYLETTLDTYMREAYDILETKVASTQAAEAVLGAWYDTLELPPTQALPRSQSVNALSAAFGSTVVVQ